MRTRVLVSVVAALALTGAILAQQKGEEKAAKQKAPPAPPLLGCGMQDDAEIICGTRSPEDLELSPDGKYLIVAQFVNGPPGQGAGMSLFDPSKKTFTKMTATAEPLKDWGDPACPGPIGDALAPHGTSIAKRSNGKMQLFIVNHGGRESIEMYELKQAGPAWNLVWHGCVTTTQAYNDVAALADGGFVATHPTALQTQTKDGKGGAGNAFGGQPSGFVSRWTPGKGEAELPGTRTGYPNGVIATPDGRMAYFAAWTVREVHKYDLRAGKELGVVKLDFMPDNLTWTKKNQVLAAGIQGIQGECPAGSGTPCIQGFGVAVVEPGKMQAKTVYDSKGKRLISGVSSALQMGNAVYVGAFQGDRLVKLNWKE
jgi:hypothetical protein